MSKLVGQKEGVEINSEGDEIRECLLPWLRFIGVAVDQFGISNKEKRWK